VSGTPVPVASQVLPQVNQPKPRPKSNPTISHRPRGKKVKKKEKEKQVCFHLLVEGRKKWKKRFKYLEMRYKLNGKIERKISRS
jgi:hypothetical protein